VVPVDNHVTTFIFESSYKVGEKKGMEIGEKKGKCDMAKLLKDNGVDTDIIIKSSGLSREEIEEL
jgi:predicted transposase/invertase (TIGR01784 family)